MFLIQTHKVTIVFNVHLQELNRLLVGETSSLGVVLRERDGSDSPYVMRSLIIFS